MTLKLERIQTFITVIESHGFSAAAKRLKISTPAVSKQISELESELGTLLIERTTRRLSLTESGETYYDQCKRLMDEVRETEAIASNLNLEPSGILRIFVARYFGEKFIIPHLQEFMTLYPKLKLEIELGERVPDPSQESIDLILGISMAGPDLWIQKKIAETRYAFCASPKYLKVNGIPKKPSDLTQHQYIHHKMRRPENLIEFDNGEKIKVTPRLTLNDTRTMLECALNSMGIVQLHHYVVDPAIQTGELIEVLERFVKPKIPIFLYYPPRRYLQSKIRRFIDFYSKKINNT